MLTEIACKAAACPADKTRARFSDGAGLYIEVASTGSKRWFWKYYFCGKEKRLALGGYPEVRVKDARICRDDARKLLRQGTDPTLQRRLNKIAIRVKSAITFELVARELHGQGYSGLPEDDYRWRLECHLPMS